MNAIYCFEKRNCRKKKTLTNKYEESKRFISRFQKGNLFTLHGSLSGSSSTAGRVLYLKEGLTDTDYVHTLSSLARDSSAE